jgi:hypothetical protein
VPHPPGPLSEKERGSLAYELKIINEKLKITARLIGSFLIYNF